MTTNTKHSLVWRVIGGFVVVVPMLVWLQSIGDLNVYFGFAVPTGQLQYILAKLFGLYAVTAIWLQVLWVLTGSNRSSRWFMRPSAQHHKWLGMFAAALCVLHGVCFAWAVSVRTDHLALHLFVPNFAKGYYQFALALGVIAFWSIGAVIYSGIKRRTSKQAIWRWLHKVALVVFSLGFVHGFMIGTESRQGVMYYFYLSLALSLGLAVLVKLSELLHGQFSKHKVVSPVRGIPVREAQK
ncbi:ferric reductase-like transmembrane domain-containing protein [Aestuariibacter sp. AA17]|uniref:Ferric reductase-like transmembrane domain-containing protein n=1 Tax=Fluctibacter corallii TaxID=2984329 RepID=A0ABT3ACG2_9ALTE|nr:ferric reductase-like transmembrane domain-containing protein [Aestuariibacter sp. AA17]MCV2886365.1 ferric reductase-like transmembrane domain-containing protein [Aestuariibacter sp. AA17]